MLAELRIRNFVLIDHLSIVLNGGLNILSGETGAGKSIVLSALNLLLGGPASSEMLREGAEEALVEGLFLIEDEPWVGQALERMGLESGGEVWIRRMIPRTGRPRAWLNGGPITLGALKELGSGLVDFSSQNEHQVLLNPASHQRILDAYGHLEPLLSSMAQASLRLAEVVAERDELRSRQQSRAEREEFLKFQLGELERCAPQAGEDEALEAERKLLSHAEKLFENARDIEQSLYATRGAVVEVVTQAVGRLEEIVRIDPALAPSVETLRGALYGLEDVARTVATYARKVRFDPARLETIGSRLAELSHIKRKYKTDLAGVLERLRLMKEELETLTGAEERLDRLDAEIGRRCTVAVAEAKQLSEARRIAAKRLEQVAESELQSLSMPSARFSIHVEPRFDLEAGELSAIGVTGVDRVEFAFSANPGEQMRPLARVASGGELSRVLLALKRSLAGAGEVGTFVFDEVDTGIGGGVAEVVGRKLAEIAAHRQLLCITHLAQIASYADRHFSVRKEVDGGRTRSRVVELSEDERIEEIARMMGGIEITARTVEHARELIERCAAFRASREETS